MTISKTKKKPKFFCPLLYWKVFFCLNQCCGAEIIFFLLRLHLCPLFWLRLQPYILPLKTVLKQYGTIKNMSQWRSKLFFFILASSKLTEVSITDHFGSNSGSATLVKKIQKTFAINPHLRGCVHI